jgi:hypothetical protein
MGEIVAQVIGQAGPAMKLARDTLGTAGGGNGGGGGGGANGAPPANGSGG